MPVVEDSDQVLCLLKIGDVVETDEGPGVLTGVQFQTAQYNSVWTLEPPQLEVQLDSGTTIHTCLCAITLPNTEKGTRLLHQEFDRLWPPRDNVPEDSQMLIPEGDEEVVPREGKKNTTMRRKAELNEPVRIYIADLGAYNAGKLVGEWIDLPADEEELEALTLKMSRGGQGDWAIHDYEAPFRIEEYEDVFVLNEAMWRIKESHVDFDIIACVKEYGGSPAWDVAIDAAEDAMVVEADSDEDLAYKFVDNMGSVSELGEETIEMYFNYEAFGRDASMELYEESDQEYYDQFSSDREYGEALVDDWGGVSVMGDKAANYFDYAAFGRDLAMDYFQCGKYYIRLDA